MSAAATAVSAAAAMSATTDGMAPPTTPMAAATAFSSPMTITAPTATPAPVAIPEKARIRRHHHRAITVTIHHADATRYGGEERDAESECEAADQMARPVAVNFSCAGKIKVEAAVQGRLAWF